jgi:hypothetical protein
MNPAIANHAIRAIAFKVGELVRIAVELGAFS